MISIRQAIPNDAPLLAEIGAETFFDAFLAENTPENIAAYLESAFSREIQAAEIAEPSSLFLIAEMDGEPVGYAQINESTPEPCVTGARHIEWVRINSPKPWIGQGVGAALMQAGLEEAARMGGDVI